MAKCELFIDFRRNLAFLSPAERPQNDCQTHACFGRAGANRVRQLPQQCWSAGIGLPGSHRPVAGKTLGGGCSKVRRDKEKQPSTGLLSGGKRPECPPF